MSVMKMLTAVFTGSLCLASPLLAQDQPAPAQPPEHVHDMEHMDMPMDGSSSSGWMLMQDGDLWLLGNAQGGPRGGHDLTAPNWWMGMATRSGHRGTLTLTGMLSLDPLTVGRRGYRELFQVGEALDGVPITDRQHPHDFWMQLSAAWRVPLGARTALTIAGGPAGEPALGPVAFMHRASAAALPLAPLSHHTLDSTHVAFGVATVGIERGPIAVEASAFNGREPDEQRWDIDFGRLDSVSGRIWYRPSPRWAMLVSSGHLVAPEQLGHGDTVRTTASASFTDVAASHLTAATVAFGMNHTEDATRRALLVEGSRSVGALLLSSRLEVVEVESELLATGQLPATPADEARKATVGAVTLAGARTVTTLRGLVLSVVGGVSFYAVPARLQASHGQHPVSFQVGFELHPRPGMMGRMWDMRMGGPPMHMKP